MVNLTSHRTAAMQAALLDNRAVALAALADGLAQSFFAGRAEGPVKVRLTECRATLERNATDFDRSPARARLDAEVRRWTQVLPQDREDWFPWLCGQPAETVLDLVVFCTSQSIDTVQRRGESQAATTRLCTALRLDMKHWWEASPATYLSLVPKAKLIEAVTEAVGAEAARDLSKLKKDEAVAHAAAKLAGTHWLPAPLRVA
jgi:ParB family transcriptional regulator, chromosome partitioning protein